MDSTSAFTCPACGFRFRVADRFLGKIATCPAERCAQKIRLKASGEPKASGTRRTTAVSGGSGNARSENQRPKRSERRSPPAIQKTVEPKAAVAKQTVSGSQRAPRTDRRRPNSAVAKSAPAMTTINPLWLGFGSVVAIAVVAGTGWWLLGGLNDETNADQIAMFGSANSGVNGIKAITSPEATLTGFRQTGEQQLNAEQVAANEKARRREQQAIASEKHLNEKFIPYLKQYCIDCHGPDSQEAGINVAELTSAEQLMTERNTWERIYRMINSGRHSCTLSVVFS